MRIWIWFMYVKYSYIPVCVSTHVPDHGNLGVSRWQKWWAQCKTEAVGLCPLFHVLRTLALLLWYIVVSHSLWPAHRQTWLCVYWQGEIPVDGVRYHRGLQTSTEDLNLVPCNQVHRIGVVRGWRRQDKGTLQFRESGGKLTISTNIYRFQYGCLYLSRENIRIFKIIFFNY